MNRLDLRDIAIELLTIDRVFPMHLKNPKKNRIGNFTMHTFDQLWGSTSGGFEGMGGSAMTNQRTYVFVPTEIIDDEDCLVFFGGMFAYYAPYSDVFKEDMVNQNMASVGESSRYR